MYVGKHPDRIILSGCYVPNLDWYYLAVATPKFVSSPITESFGFVHQSSRSYNQSSYFVQQFVILSREISTEASWEMFKSISEREPNLKFSWTDEDFVFF